MLLGMLLVHKVAAFLRECNQVGEGHSTKADMVGRINGVGLNVLRMVVVQPSLKFILQIVGGNHWLHMVGHHLHLLPLDLAVEFPHCHLLHRNCEEQNFRKAISPNTPFITLNTLKFSFFILWDNFNPTKKIHQNKNEEHFSHNKKLGLLCLNIKLSQNLSLVKL